MGKRLGDDKCRSIGERDAVLADKLTRASGVLGDDIEVELPATRGALTDPDLHTQSGPGAIVEVALQQDQELRDRARIRSFPGEHHAVAGAHLRAPQQRETGGQ